MVSFSFFSIASSSQSMKTVSNQNGHGAKANPFWAHGFFKIIHLTSPRSMKQQFRGQNKAEVDPSQSGAAEVAAFVKTPLT